MTIHYPVGLENRFNTHRIVDAKGQIIARTEMGPATAVELRDALNAQGWRKCSEEMPPNFGDTLLTGAAFGVAVGYFWDFPEHLRNEVSHWMPLPKGPK